MRPRLPEWLNRVCCCAECGKPLVVTAGGWVSCLWPGHTGLIRQGDFGELVRVAWGQARKNAIVKRPAEWYIRKALAALRGEPGAAGRVSGDDSTRAHADLFADCPTDGDRATDAVRDGGYSDDCDSGADGPG